MLGQVYCITGHSCHRRLKSFRGISLLCLPIPSFSCGGGGISNTEQTAQTALCLVPDDSGKEDGVGPANSGSSGKPTFCCRSGTAGGSALPSPDAPPPGRARPPPLPLPIPAPIPLPLPLPHRGSGRSAPPEFTGGFSSLERRQESGMSCSSLSPCHQSLILAPAPQDVTVPFGFQQDKGKEMAGPL